MRFITLLQNHVMKPAFRLLKRKAAEKAREREEGNQSTNHGHKTEGENG